MGNAEQILMGKSIVKALGVASAMPAYKSADAICGYNPLPLHLPEGGGALSLWEGSTPTFPLYCFNCRYVWLGRFPVVCGCEAVPYHTPPRGTNC